MNKKVIALGTFIIGMGTATGYALYSRIKKIKENEVEIEETQEESE